MEKSARTPITTGPPTVDDFGFASQVYINTSFLRTVFKCDKSGYRVEEAMYKRVSGTSIGGAYRSVTHLGTTKYGYDGEGHRTEIALHNPSGRLIQRYRFVYQGSAHPVERIEYDNNGAIVNREYYTYELDQVGNWTKRLTTRVDGEGNKGLAEPVEATYQIITY